MTAVRRTQLTRLGVWIGLATAGRADRGRRRAHRDRHAPHRDACSRRTAGGRRAAQRTLRSSPTRQFDQEAEQRRLSEAVRTARRRPRPAARAPQYARTQPRGRDRLDRPAAPRSCRRPPPPSDIAATARPRRQRRAGRARAGRRRARSRVAAGHLATGNPARREVGRDQDRVRRRPRRQRHDRGTAHAVDAA